MRFRDWAVLAGIVVCVAWIAPFCADAETVEIVADEDVIDTPTPVPTPADEPSPTPIPPSPTESPTSTSTRVPPSPTGTPTETNTPKPTEPEEKKDVYEDDEKEAREEAWEEKAAEARSSREPGEEDDEELLGETRTETVSSRDRTARISDKTGFDFLVRSGWVVTRRSQVGRIGKIVGGPAKEDSSYTQAKPVYVRLRKGQGAQSGDRWVVFRFGGTVRDPGTNRVLGTQVVNLGIARVVEVQEGRCLVKMLKSYNPCMIGDEVRPYEEEVTRWKESRRVRELPASPIVCRVVGGDPMNERYGMNDYVILSAGQDRGVVAGQLFQLRQRDSVAGMGLASETPIGRVRIVHSGPFASVGKILMNKAPIPRGTRAVYAP